MHIVSRMACWRGHKQGLLSVRQRSECMQLWCWCGCDWIFGIDGFHCWWIFIRANVIGENEKTLRPGWSRIFGYVFRCDDAVDTLPFNVTLNVFHISSVGIFMLAWIQIFIETMVGGRWSALGIWHRQCHSCHFLFIHSNLYVGKFNRMKQ